MATETFPLDPQAVPLEWHEAVALVQEVAGRCLAGADVLAHRPADISIDREGNVITAVADSGFTARGALKAARDAQRVGDLRLLLKELLPQTPIPPGLSALAEASENTSVNSIEEFSKMLSFFERPGRARDLKVVAARQAAAHDQTILNQQLAELTRKARHEPQTAAAAAPATSATPVTPAASVDGSDFLSELELEKPDDDAPEPGKERRPVSDRLQAAARHNGVRAAAMATVVVALLVVVGVAAYQLTSAEGSTADVGLVEQARSSTATPEATTGNAAAQPNAAATSATAAHSAARSAAGSTKSEKPAEKPAARASERAPRTEAATDAVAPASNGTEIPTIVARNVAPIPLLFDLGPRDQATEVRTVLGTSRLDLSSINYETVYDIKDSRVAPARLVRPQLPEIPPDTPVHNLGLFEFVVSMRGTVERIRLVRSPADGQYRDIMLLPAAKAWIFQPATIDGAPVRYRLQIPIPQ